MHVCILHVTRPKTQACLDWPLCKSNMHMMIKFFLFFVFLLQPFNATEASQVIACRHSVVKVANHSSSLAISLHAHLFNCRNNFRSCALFFFFFLNTQTCDVKFTQPDLRSTTMTGSHFPCYCYKHKWYWGGKKRKYMWDLGEVRLANIETGKPISVLSL